jgi:N-methylhydantoinase B
MTESGNSTAVLADAGATSLDDAVTLQVVHNRLETLMRLMTSTMEQLAGTAVGRESGDYSTAFMDAEGNVIAFGSAVCTHLGHEVKIVPWIAENIGLENIKPGDIFMSNDPYTGGSVHCNDVGCVAPVFAEGEILGWVFCDMHFADVGGMVPGSFAPNAIDVQSEAVRFPPIRIYAEGVYREEVVHAFITNTRIPTQIARDIASEVGALHFGIRAVTELAETYGATELRRILAGLLDFSEQSFRARLRELPDGVFEATDYIEDGYLTDKIYACRLRMTKFEDELYLDYRGSSDAAPALINCSEAGLIGGVMGPLIQQLATGIPFNGGVMRPVHVAATPGSFVNCVPPSPLGIATGYGAMAVQDSAATAASTLLAAGEDPYLQERATAQWGGNLPCFIFTGASNQYGQYSVFLNMDPIGGEGQGAMKGLDGGRGNYICLYGSIPSVEAHEITEPFLYLAREIGEDSGGAGKWRGGFSVRGAVVVYGEETSPQSGTFCTGRNAVPTRGAAGGYPSSGVYYGPLSGSPAWDDLHDGRIWTWHELMEEYGENLESLPSKVTWEGERSIDKGPGCEVFMMTCPGGGGYGDPLEREPGAVALDVAAGIVSRAAARSAYGVILDEAGSFDATATEAERAKLREQRFSRAGAASSRFEANGAGAAAGKGLELGSVEVLVDSGIHRCASCQTEIAPAEGNWKDFVPHAQGPAVSLEDRGLGETYKVHPNDAVSVAEFFCPGCKGLLAVELYVEGDSFRRDYRPVEQAKREGYDAAADFAENPGAWLSFA